jgi:hypothetical protein
LARGAGFGGRGVEKSGHVELTHKKLALLERQWSSCRLVVLGIDKLAGPSAGGKADAAAP